MPPFRILVVQRLRCLWVARLMEHDIVVEGRTADAAMNGLIRIVVAHIEYDRRHDRRPLSAFTAAPIRYADLFAWGTELDTHREHLEGGDELSFRIAVARERTADRWAYAGPVFPEPEPAKAITLSSSTAAQPRSRAS